nr:helix-turn-helix transcriptional regulator [Enterococcus innesii]
MSGALGNKEVMAKNLSYYMQKNNVTRNKLSDDLGISYTTIRDWVKAKTYPRIDKIELLANYFGIDKSDLVEEKSISDRSIISIYGKLDPNRQEVVYKCAEEQLEEQQKEKIVSLPKKRDARDFAAHSDDPNKKVTEEEKERIHDFLDYLDEKHDKNK